MDYKNIIYQVDEGIATIRLNRPHKLNALSIATFEELHHSLNAAETDQEVRVVILTGEGRAFCAGDDVNDFNKAGETPAEVRAFVRHTLGVFVKIEKLAKPVIAAVNGYAIGGGCELVVACDIVIASEAAIIALPEGRTGGFAGFSLHRLAQIVGTKKTMEILLTGDRMDAQEACRIGLVNKVVPAAELEAEARKMAKRIMTNAPLAVSVTKGLVNKTRGAADVEETILGGCLLLLSRDFTRDRNTAFDKLKV